MNLINTQFSIYCSFPAFGQSKYRIEISFLISHLCGVRNECGRLQFHIATSKQFFHHVQIQAPNVVGLAASTCCHKSKHFACMYSETTHTHIHHFSHRRITLDASHRMSTRITKFFQQKKRMEKVKSVVGVVGSIVKGEKERKSKAETKSRPKINISKYAESIETRPTKICFHFQFIFVDKKKIISIIKNWYFGGLVTL